MQNRIWQPTAAVDALRRRAAMLQAIRTFFARRDVLEVDTPVLSGAAATDPHLGSFATHYGGPGDAPRRLYLHTSPEFPMKRLLAAGSGPIYQICKVFRDGEAGRRHNPEFTMLEWYRPGFGYHDLMDEVEELLTEALGTAAATRLRYGDVFRQYLGLDPHLATVSELATCAERQGLGTVAGMADADADAWRDLLLSHCIEHQLGRGAPTFLYDFPASQAALARVRPGNPALAERFELYIDGVEIANGYQELTDAAEQRRRFEADQLRREQYGLPTVSMDARLLAAMEHGLPECAGVAVGVDRLLMAALGTTSIDDVIAFPVQIA